MPANLLDGYSTLVDAYSTVQADGTVLCAEAPSSGARSYFVHTKGTGTFPVRSAETAAVKVHAAFGARAADSDFNASLIMPWCLYISSDGRRTHGYGSSLSGTVLASSWTRFSVDISVPSGATIVGFGIGVSNGAKRFYGSGVSMSIGGPAALCSCKHSRSVVEWLGKGTYYVQQPDSYSDGISLECYDSLYLLSKLPYSKVGTAYPATLQTIISDCCAVAGIQWFSKVPSSVMAYRVPRRPYAADLSAFQMCAYAAQCAGAFIRMDNSTDMLCVDWYDTAAFEQEDWADGGTMNSSTAPYASVDTADGGTLTASGTPYSDGAKLDGGTFDTDSNLAVLSQFSSLTVGTDDIVVTGVKVQAQNQVVTESDGTESNGAEGETYTAGKAGYVLDLGTNPLVAYGQAKTVAEQVYARVGGMRFRRFSAEAPLLDPSVEPGDPISIEDRFGNVYRSYVTHVTLSVGGSMKLVCGAATTARSSMTSVSPEMQAIIENRNAIMRELTAREAMEKNINTRLSETSGLYQTVETLADGSKVYYMHDRPTLAASKVVWKMNSGAIGVSVDGGKTYTTGLTAEGDALMNRIYANGIDGQYIKAGTLMQVGDESNNVEISGDSIIGHIDGKQSFTIKSKSNSYSREDFVTSIKRLTPEPGTDGAVSYTTKNALDISDSTNTAAVGPIITISAYKTTGTDVTYTVHPSMPTSALAKSGFSYTHTVGTSALTCDVKITSSNRIQITLHPQVNLVFVEYASVEYYYPTPTAEISTQSEKFLTTSNFKKSIVPGSEAYSGIVRTCLVWNNLAIWRNMRFVNGVLVEVNDESL